MRRILSKLQQQRGQVIVMFVAIFTVLTVVGVITVDFGLWFSERRGAQTDADLPALAGAREYMLWLAQGNRCEDAGAPDQAVEDAVDDWFSLNNGGNASLVSVDANCPCVDVTVKHDTEKLFSSLYSSIFDEFDPDNIGAHARACAGAANAPEQTTPFETDNNSAPCFNADETPNFTTLCGLEFGAQAENPRGMLDLETKEDGPCSQASGSGDIEETIEWGARGLCIIDETPGSCVGGAGGPWYECAATQTGNPKNVLDGTAARIAREPLCDGSDTNKIDDFDESVDLIFDTGDPATSLYQAKDCDPGTDGEQISPRLITIIVFDEYPTDNNTGYSIVAFAGFYLAGCAVDDDGAEVDEGGAETGAECNNALDDDDDGKVNDGCKKQGPVAETGEQCNNDLDDDGDGKVNDGCPVKEDAECNNNLDDDNDGKVNDGCKKKGGAIETVCDETACADADGVAPWDNCDDDGDDAINDGCPVLVTEADLYDPDYPERRTCGQDSDGVGHVVVFGKFVRLVTSGGIGPIDPSTTMFSIALTE